MADPKTTLESLIAEHGGTLVRQKKHKVYRFPNGTTFVVASTPECPLAYDNALSHLKRILGIYPPDRGAPGTRRNKRLKQKVSGGRTLPLENKKVERVDSWKDKLTLAVMQLTPPAPPKPKPQPQSHFRKPRPLTFQERMIRAGVIPLSRE